jgi:nitrogen fixation protein FixH
MSTETAKRPARRRPPGQVKGWHVLVMILSFFSVVIGVNATFITFAVRTFPGEEVKKSYVQGRDFNDTLAARQAMRDLGWRAALDLRAGPEGRVLTAELADADGVALVGRTVEGTLRRPLTAVHDTTLPLTEVAPGRYESAPLTGELAALTGRFQLSLAVQGEGETPVFTAERTVELGTP